MQMKQNRIWATAILVLLTAIPSAFAAQRPDLSGRWIMDTEASNSPTAKSGAKEMKIGQTTDLFTVETTENGKPSTLTIKFDGTETVNELTGMTVKSRGKWEGDKLVVHNTFTGPDGKPKDTTASWFLRDGALVIQNAKGAETVYRKGK